MNWWFLFVVSVTITVSSTKCDKLSKEENEQRKAECGKLIAAKIFGGRKTNREESPWTVYMKVTDAAKKVTACTAVIVSPRHILTAAHCFAKWNAKKTGFDKVALSGESLDKCNGDDFVIDDAAIAGRVMFYEGENITASSPVVAKARNISLINACKQSERPVDITDLAVIELEKNLTLGPTLNMACVSSTFDEIAPFITLDFYGYGRKPAKGSNADSALPIMLYEESHVLRPQFEYRRPQNASDNFFSNQTFFARSSAEEFIACMGDYGGGATRKVLAQVTVVGILSQSSCEAGAQKDELRKKMGLELFVAVAAYEGKICEHSGICLKNGAHMVSLYLFVALVVYFLS